MYTKEGKRTEKRNGLPAMDLVSSPFPFVPDEWGPKTKCDEPRLVTTQIWLLKSNGEYKKKKQKKN